MKEKYHCRDCDKVLKMKGDEILDGKLLKYKEEDKTEHIVFKCNECFKKNPSLTNYQPCEVYSRIVGYLRPVQQWHASKQEEFRQRKLYKIKVGK